MTESGMPSSADRAVPSAKRASLAFAAARAPASSSATKLLSCGSSRRMRSRQRSRSASAVNVAAAQAGAKVRKYALSIAFPSVALKRLPDSGRQPGGATETRQYRERDQIGRHVHDVGADRYAKTLQAQFESFRHAKHQTSCCRRPRIPAADDQCREHQIAAARRSSHR